MYWFKVNKHGYSSFKRKFDTWTIYSCKFLENAQLFQLKIIDGLF